MKSLSALHPVRIKEVIKRNGSIALFDPEKITNAIYKAALSVGGKDRPLAQKLAAQVLEQIHRTYRKKSIPSVEEIQDIIEKVLIENRHARTAKAFILYRAERQRLREKKTVDIAVDDTIPYKLLWKAYTWNVDHSCHTVNKLNAQMRGNNWEKLAQDAEAQYHLELDQIVSTLRTRAKETRLFIVAGPSSSGKTTTTLKIGQALEKINRSFVTLNLDHYFKGLRHHPKDEYGDYDYEGPEALELEMINDHLQKLLQGKTVRTPIYDFKTGQRKDGVVPFKVAKNQIILIDSLHGLYEPMTQAVPRENKFKFYIEAMCQIKNSDGEFVRWADLRMLRRMIRDRLHRGSVPWKTVGHWHYVRRSEKQYIVPFIRSADAVFNGSIAYELPVYKIFLEKYMPKVIQHFKNDPKKFDAFTRAKRVSQLLSSIEAFPNVETISKYSLLREFIGGSAYRY